MEQKIISRIQKASGVPNLLEILSDKLSPSDLQSLMLEVYSLRAKKLTSGDLLRNYQNDPFVKPSRTDVEVMRIFDDLAFQLAKRERFEPVELSPLAPLGSCSVVATVHQNKVVSTSRNTEVVADCTNLMALECAIRRLALLKVNPKSIQKVRLCASHRHMRTQPLPDPRFLPHFRIFGLCTAGRDEGSFAFELSSLREHLTFYLSLTTAHASPFLFKNIEVLVTNLTEGRLSEAIRQQVFDPLMLLFPSVSFRFFPERETGRGYYSNLSFQVNAENSGGIHFNLADGGATDWTQKLTSNRKERLFISGIGSELICLHFRV